MFNYVAIEELIKHCTNQFQRGLPAQPLNLRKVLKLYLCLKVHLKYEVKFEISQRSYIP